LASSIDKKSMKVSLHQASSLMQSSRRRLKSIPSFYTKVKTIELTPSGDELNQSLLSINSFDSNNNEKINIVTLIIICTLFILLQSFGFRNIAIQSFGRYSPYNNYNPNSNWCPYATCTNTPKCQPCQRRFLILIATGRSGSTTLMNLLDSLPHVRMAGENKGQLINDFNTYFNFHDTIEFDIHNENGVDGAWKHYAMSNQALSCPIQSMYEAINPPPELMSNYRGNYDDSEMILGFKTVRLHQALPNIYNTTSTTTDSDLNKKNEEEEEVFLKWEEFLKNSFPCAKFVFNIRGDIEKQVESWLSAFGTHLDGDIIRNYNQNLSHLAARLGPDRARVIDMSEWSKQGGYGLNILNDLVSWLGFSDCKFTSLIHSNKDGYGKDKRKVSLGKHCRL